MGNYFDHNLNVRIFVKDFAFVFLSWCWYVWSFEDIAREEGPHSRCQRHDKTLNNKRMSDGRPLQPSSIAAVTFQKICCHYQKYCISVAILIIFSLCENMNKVKRLAIQGRYFGEKGAIKRVFTPHKFIKKKIRYMYSSYSKPKNFDPISIIFTLTIRYYLKSRNLTFQFIHFSFCFISIILLLINYFLNSYSVFHHTDNF